MTTWGNFTSMRLAVIRHNDVVKVTFGGVILSTGWEAANSVSAGRL